MTDMQIADQAGAVRLIGSRSGLTEACVKAATARG